MKSDTPLQTLFEGAPGPLSIELPDELARLYGNLSFKIRGDGPLIIGNFVSSLDGVVSLDQGKSGGGAISGGNAQDLMVMGLLRAVADAVMEGAGTLCAAPGSILTAGHVYPPMQDAFSELRRRLGKPEAPLNVIVSESGDLDMRMRIFNSSEVDVLIVTGAGGARKLASKKLPPRVKVRQASAGDRPEAEELIDALGLAAGQILLAEGGPRLLGSLIKGHQLHELFLTLAPQLAGRDDLSRRPGLVSGQIFAPEDPRWANLMGIKKIGSHLFLRYDFSGLHPGR